MATIDSFSPVGSGVVWSSALALSAAAACVGTSAFMPLPSSTVGSGGVATPETVLARHQWSDSSGYVSLRVATSLTPAQQLDFVREVLSISITDLADLLDVARPTVYAWMQGTATPRDEHLARLNQVEQQAHIVEAFGLLNTAKLLKRPLRDGTSLLQRLKQQLPLDSALSELAELNRLERQQRVNPKGRAFARTAAEAAADQSTPGYTTEA